MNTQQLQLIQERAEAASRSLLSFLGAYHATPINDRTAVDTALAFYKRMYEARLEELKEALENE